MDTRQLLSLPVSWQSKIWLPIEKEIPIHKVLGKIQSGALDAEIERIRQFLAAGDMESFAMYKKCLPAVTFCGSFEDQRKTETLKTYNRVIVLDIDKLEAEAFANTAAILESDPFVLSYWTSPSGKGFKGLVALSYNFPLEGEAIAAIHKKAFQKFAQYFFEQYRLELDESGCDITRLCFLSSDLDLVIKRRADPFLIESQDLKERFRPKKGGPQTAVTEDKRRLQFKNKPEEKARIEAVIRYLREEGLSITESYEQWYRTAYALAEAFTYKVGLAYYLELCALDGNRFAEPACRAMFYYCYKNADGRIKLNSLLFYAGRQGFRPEADRDINLNSNEHGSDKKDKQR